MQNNFQDAMIMTEDNDTKRHEKPRHEKTDEANEIKQRHRSHATIRHTKAPTQPNETRTTTTRQRNKTKTTPENEKHKTKQPESANTPRHAHTYAHKRLTWYRQQVGCCRRNSESKTQGRVCAPGLNTDSISQALHISVVLGTCVSLLSPRVFSLLCSSFLFLNVSGFLGEFTALMSLPALFFLFLFLFRKSKSSKGFYSVFSRGSLHFQNSFEYV